MRIEVRTHLFHVSYSSLARHPPEPISILVRPRLFCYPSEFHSPGAKCVAPSAEVTVATISSSGLAANSCCLKDVNRLGYPVWNRW